MMRGTLFLGIHNTLFAIFVATGSIVSRGNSSNSITPDDVYLAVKEGVRFVNDLEQEWSKGTFDLFVEAHHVTGYYRPPTNRFVKYGRFGMIKDYASQILAKKLKKYYSPPQISEYLERLDLSHTFFGNGCPIADEIRFRPCPKLYRTVDGFCNNLRHPTWGMAELPPQRLLPSVYNDGVSEIRRAKDGSDLPNARLTSTNCLPSEIISHQELTVMMTTFGQIIDHDLTLFPTPTGFRFPRLQCCPIPYQNQKLHPYCFALPIPLNDPFYSRYNVDCMEVMRSLPGVGVSCNLGTRQQVNQLTNYIDASTVYGNTEDEAKLVRAFERGLLKTQPHPYDHRKKDLLPLANGTIVEECLVQSAKPHPCFMAGELRSNENSPLTTMHTIFMREHNRLVEKMLLINPQWGDEKMFQEVRRIFAAMKQHIAYKEYLPKFFGPSNIFKHQLALHDTGYFTGYDEEEDATIVNAFSSAAFRFSHSLLNTNILRVGHFNRYASSIPLRDLFFQPELLYETSFPGGIDPLLRGSTAQMAQALDINIAENVKNHLFQPADQPFGMDLMSLNILRGRDNGLPPYNDWREFCGLPRLNYWDEAYKYLFPEAVVNISRTYSDIDDIDLWIGGISELPMDGALIGPTFACIVGIQFRKLRFGDRFWYENPYIPGVVDYPFTPDQLQEIRKSSLSKIICQNGDSFLNVQRDVFLMPGLNNPLVACKDIEDINLEYWRQEK